MVNLQFNYPVLPGTDEQFGELLQQIAKDTKEMVQPVTRGGSERHRRAAAEWLSRRGAAFDPSRVLIGSGGHNAVMAAMMHAGMIGGKVAVDPLTYSGFKEQTQVIGCAMVACEGDDSGMLPEALEEGAKQGAKAVYLMPTVHNPLGTVMPESRRVALAEVARKHNLLIIDDDAYGFMEANPPKSFAELAPERAIFVASLTKPYSPVLKIAFVVVPEAIVPQMAEQLHSLSSGASALLSEVAVRLTLEGTLAKVLAAKREEAAHRQKIAAEEFAGIKVQAHPTSYHLWIDLESQATTHRVDTEVTHAGIRIDAGQHFAADDSVKRTGIRVALGAVRDEEVLRGALRVVAKTIRGE